MKSFFAAAAAMLATLGLASSQTALAQSAPAASRFEAVYAVHARGMEAGEYRLNIRFNGAGYEASADRRMTGVARMALGNSQDYRYTVRGQIAADGRLQPVAYQHQGGRRNRLVRVAFGADDVVTTAEPAMGMGNPPATRQQKLGSIDQITMFAALLRTQGDPCRQSLRIFMDGRARFDLAMSPAGTERVRIGAFNGQAQRCSVAYRPVAGFPDPQEASTLTFVFARQPNGWQAPIRIEMPSDDAGVVRLQARSFTIG